VSYSTPEGLAIRRRRAVRRERHRRIFHRITVLLWASTAPGTKFLHIVSLAPDHGVLVPKLASRTQREGVAHRPRLRPIYEDQRVNAVVASSPTVPPRPDRSPSTPTSYGTIVARSASLLQRHKGKNRRRREAPMWGFEGIVAVGIRSAHLEPGRERESFRGQAERPWRIATR